MFAIALSTYLVPMDEVQKHTDEHRAYLRALHARGVLVASGPLVPRTGGALLFCADSPEAVQALLSGDPFQQRGIARYDVRMWDPGIGGDELQGLVNARQ